MFKKKSLDIYLAEVFKQFIAIKDDDYKKSQEVFLSVFEEVKRKMGDQCNYFKCYSTQTMLAGSVYDRIKVSKMDEFDIDLVIRLPISYEAGENGISIHNDQAGYIKMHIGQPFDNLDKQPEWEKRHKVTREWRDDDKFFLQNKFRQWIHGIVQRAVNEMQNKATVGDMTYQLKYKEGGPAFTLNISHDGDLSFNLDVDLVPVIKFSDNRWPEGYRTPEELGISPGKFWLAVPKPNKFNQNEGLRNRCWRLSFQEYEKEIMKDCQQLKMTIRLVKKLRDQLKMNAIASYYIKTLFLWKVNEMKDKSFWQKKVSWLFHLMVEELYKAIKNKNIPFFWQEDNNLIDNLKPTLQKVYSEKLKLVLDSIEANNVDRIVTFLLTTNELTEFKQSEFYQKQLTLLNINREDSTKSVQSTKSDVSKDDTFKELEKKLAALMEKVDNLTNKAIRQDERIKALELKTDSVENSNVLAVGAALIEKVDDLTNKAINQDERIKVLEFTTDFVENKNVL